MFPNTPQSLTALRLCRKAKDLWNESIQTWCFLFENVPYASKVTRSDNIWGSKDLKASDRKKSNYTPPPNTSYSLDLCTPVNTVYAYLTTTSPSCISSTLPPLTSASPSHGHKERNHHESFWQQVLKTTWCPPEVVCMRHSMWQHMSASPSFRYDTQCAPHATHWHPLSRTARQKLNAKLSSQKPRSTYFREKLTLLCCLSRRVCRAMSRSALTQERPGDLLHASSSSF